MLIGCVDEVRDCLPGVLKGFSGAHRQGVHPPVDIAWDAGFRPAHRGFGREEERRIFERTGGHGYERSDRTLLGAPGIATRNKKLLVTKGIATSSKDVAPGL